MSTVIQIIADHLRAIGADGLVAPDECGCELSDLAPCGGPPGECKPGWKGADTDPGAAPDAWLMFGTKEAAADASKHEGGPA